MVTRIIIKDIRMRVNIMTYTNTISGDYQPDV